MHSLYGQPAIMLDVNQPIPIEKLYLFHNFESSELVKKKFLIKFLESFWVHCYPSIDALLQFLKGLKGGKLVQFIFLTQIFFNDCFLKRAGTSIPPLESIKKFFFSYMGIWQKYGNVVLQKKEKPLPKHCPIKNKWNTKHSIAIPTHNWFVPPPTTARPLHMYFLSSKWSAGSFAQKK